MILERRALTLLIRLFQKTIGAILAKGRKTSLKFRLRDVSSRGIRRYEIETRAQSGLNEGDGGSF